MRVVTVLSKDGRVAYKRLTHLMLRPFEIGLSLPDTSSSTNHHRSTTKAHSVL